MSAVGWTPVGAPGAPGLAGANGTSGPKAHADVRISNMSLLLRRLQVEPRSRAGLTEVTGLSKATVSTLVAEMVARRLVIEESPRGSGTVGRPRARLRIAPGSVAGIGLEIGSASLNLTVMDLTGEVLRQHTRPMTGSGRAQRIINEVGRLLAEEVTTLRADGALVPGIVLAQPGVLDYARGRVHTSTPLGWHDVPLLENVETALAHHMTLLGGAGNPLPHLTMENDAKLAALAVYGAYADQDVRNLLYLSGGRGIGAGIIADGQLLRGWLGMTGEVGHMPVSPGEGYCRCGRRGCWETQVGLDAVCAPLPEGDPARDEARSVAERTALLREHLNAADTTLTAHLEGVRKALERGLSILVDVLSPQVIVLSGWPAAFADMLLGPVQLALEERRLEERLRVRVEVSPLGEWAASRGAALVALESVFDDPSLAPVQDPGA